jgi:hypothetical protein
MIMIMALRPLMMIHDPMTIQVQVPRAGGRAGPGRRGRPRGARPDARPGLTWRLGQPQR